ncbi:helix-turn-helix domain-containing protein [Actinocrispum wychmicini]|uniref:Helix-turn-helix protein n=1 Tax=Actinocrispum wychmicini TaxID=1213861 RepID=A0A4R2JYH4_9PSEU|nr:hypothetical protein [Actinocrispum wychmicini]TCO64367.1 hypothetical protein EV192_101135 [Actinocrispum wychmicini]
MSRVRFAAIRWAREAPTLLHHGRVDRLGHHLLVVMASYARNDGTDIYVSTATLAREVHATVGEVQTAVDRLERAGLLARAAASNGASGWRLNLTHEHGPDTVTQTRAERRRAATRERVRRLRERTTTRSANTTVERDVTPESSVTNAEVQRYSGTGVTQDSNAVTQDSNACNAPGSVTSAGQQGYNSLRTPLTPIPSLTRASLGEEDRRDSHLDTPSMSLVLASSIVDAKRSQAGRASRTNTSYTPAFEAWWTLYPRKVDKLAASRKFATALKHTNIETVTDGVRRYAAEVDGRLPEHIKHAATWLHGRCWENGTPDTAESVVEWVRDEWHAGRVKPIEERTGLHYDPPDLPLDVTGRDAVEEFHANACRDWITAHRDMILDRLTARSAS